MILFAWANEQSVRLIILGKISLDLSSNTSCALGLLRSSNHTHRCPLGVAFQHVLRQHLRQHLKQT